MNREIRWSESQKRAWWFAIRAEREGMSAREGLRQYRAGGGHIGTDYWFELYRTVRWTSVTGDSIIEIPENYTISDEFHLEVPFNYRQEYIYTVHLYGRDPETDMPLERYITVESDYPLSRREIEFGAYESLQYTIGTPPFIIDNVAEIAAYKRVR